MYLSQHEKTDNSFAIACINALKYFCVNLTRKQWQRVFKVHLQGKEKVKNYTTFMKDLGLQIEYISKDCNRPPFLIHHFTKYTGLQTSLVVDAEDNMWTIVNPQGLYEETVIKVNKDELDIFDDIGKGGGCKKLAFA